MKAKTRIYAVTDKSDGAVLLVRAYSSTQARSFVAEREFSVEVATTETVVKHMKLGGDVVDAAKPETAEERVDPVDGDMQGLQGAIPRSTHINEVA